MDFLDRLNDKQREAVLHTEGPLLVLAGAGSGKTSMMTCRIAYLIEEKGVSPYNILAVTFTNKAAKEMRDRVESLLADSGRYTTQGMWIQTFHSACLRILRMKAELVGYGKDFVVYDPTDQKTVVKAIEKELNIDEKNYKPAYFLSIIGECKERGISPDEYREINGDGFRDKMIADVYEGYMRALKKNNAMDFDDLLANTVKLFETSEETLEEYRKRFKYIMVDEYQDTNMVQYKFVKLLAEGHNNICVVGDDDQCIYQWRGADITNILNFEKDFKGTKVVKLEQNYRSYGNILAAANSVIVRNRNRKEKALWTSQEPGELIRYTVTDNEREEARFVGQEISHLQGTESASGKALRYGDFAVLYRTNAQSRTFEEAFRRMGIPAKVVGNVGFYDRKEIKDVMSYMRLVQNPKDDVSFMRIVNEPKRGIGDKTVEKLQALAMVRGESMLELLHDPEVRGSLSGKAAESIEQLVAMLDVYSEEKENLTILDIYDGILAKSGYMQALELQNTVEAEGRIENIMELRSAIEDFQNTNPQGTLIEFLEGKALASDSDKLPEGKEAEEGEEVLLMTLHTAKGLEFPVVFMPGMEAGLFPGRRAMDSEEGLEEERRLCYVGITRAKERLYLISASSRMIYGRTEYSRESCFLKEIDRNLMTGDAPWQEKKKQGFVDGYAPAAPHPKPFDSLKYAKMEVSAKKGAGESLNEGDRVSHSKFGAGTVIAVDAKTVTVEFDSEGRKKLAKDVAPIKKI